MTVVLDTSAVLAVVFSEPGSRRVDELLDDFLLSSVNLGEAVTKLIEKGYSDEDAKRSLEGFLPAVVPFDLGLALNAGLLRRHTHVKGLSLGDRACLALAMRENATAITTDRVWSEVDVDVNIELIR